jgi:hypothetical protein
MTTSDRTGIGRVAPSAVALIWTPRAELNWRNVGLLIGRLGHASTLGSNAEI